MTTTRVSALAVGCLLAAAFGGQAVRPGAPRSAEALSSHLNIPLWEDGHVPLAAGNGPLDRPFLTAFLPPAGKSNGSSVIIAPGGGNIMLMYGAEGLEVAERYNDWGVTAFVLTYRLSPRYNEAARVLDGERAIQIVRANAQSLASRPRTHRFDRLLRRVEHGTVSGRRRDCWRSDAADPIERVSSRPDYLALVYGAGRATPVNR